MPKPDKRKPVPSAKRSYLKQADVPGASFEEALRVPQAIFEHYAGKSTSPLHVAKALNMDPRGSQMKVLTGAAIAFGLIDGGAQAAAISVTELGRRILHPTEETAELAAKREAVLRPRIFGEFLRRYDGSPCPRADIAINVLEELGVPRAKAAEVNERIFSTARAVGFIEEIKSKPYVSLQGTPGTPAAPPFVIEPGKADVTQGFDEPEAERAMEAPKGTVNAVRAVSNRSSELAAAIIDDDRRRRVFVTHGKNGDLVDPIKKLLEYGELEPVVSVEKSSVSKPVPEKVMGEMRGCGAAIIHVDADTTIKDGEGKEYVQLNPNVLIEIGAAMAFYGRRFILLVRDGIKLPSNLQGLFEVRYQGATLDATETIRLLEAIRDIKNHPLPGEAT